MQKLLQGLADLSSLRDRDDLDLALSGLIAKAVPEAIGTTRLVRTIGLAEDQRWLIRAQKISEQTKPERDQVWADWSALPHLSAFPQRQAAMSTGKITRAEGSPCCTVFPIDTRSSVCSLLEVESAQALSAQSEASVQSVLKIYQNLQGLLDYGERDALTDLLNRKSFDNAFLRAVVEQDTDLDPEQANRRHEQAQGSYWLTMIDIDHFKRVNDNYGHLIGDEVLLLLARLMRATFRFHDQLYRFGGEEFVVLLRCADHADVSAVLERFRHRVEEFSFPQVGTITVSVGFTELRPNDMPGVAFDRADKAVYYAKAHGRNQVCSYSELVVAGELSEQTESANDVSFF